MTDESTNKKAKKKLFVFIIELSSPNTHTLIDTNKNIKLHLFPFCILKPSYSLIPLKQQFEGCLLFIASLSISKIEPLQEEKRKKKKKPKGLFCFVLFFGDGGEERGILEMSFRRNHLLRIVLGG